MDEGLAEAQIITNADAHTKIEHHDACFPLFLAGKAVPQGELCEGGGLLVRRK